ncbi:AAA family ATPase [Candidatus Nomurabacteria bacterium]|nr:AAA family ATPase [Candidatus Nomurabacteria bacterium]
MKEMTSLLSWLKDGNNHMKKKLIYITGISGTGKTTLFNEFVKKGYSALEIDEFSHWENRETGDRISWSPGASKEYLDTHRWVCDMGALNSAIQGLQDENIYIFGVVDQNPFDFFDKVILLQCSIETAFNRVDKRSDNPFGKGEVEKQWIKGWKDGFESDLLDMGATPVSGEDDIESITQNIISICK